MFKEIYLYTRWTIFLIKIILNYKWICTTKEGCIYLKQHLLKLGITGIKIGQMIYSNDHIISRENKHILEDLLSHNPSHSISETYKMIKMCKDINIINDIESIDEDILGSGSLAQVQKCSLKTITDKKCVIKVCHPVIFELEKEIQILQNLITWMCYFIKVDVEWSHFFKNIYTQIDMNYEASNIKLFKEISKNYNNIEIPELIYSSNYFIIMTFCEGIEMYKLNKNSELYTSATNIISAFSLYTFHKFSINHGDLHEGNILVKPNGDIALVDFGIVNILEPNINNNQILYFFQKCKYKLRPNNLLKLFEFIVVNDKRLFIPGFIQKCQDFIKTNHLTNQNRIQSNLSLINCLVSFCKQYNLQINSVLINSLMQFFNLDSFHIYPDESSVVLRTTSYMKKDDFFMKEIGDYILKLYKLECKYANTNSRYVNKYIE